MQKRKTREEGLHEHGRNRDGEEEKKKQEGETDEQCHLKALSP
jgi:hypothetical protein